MGVLYSIPLCSRASVKTDDNDENTDSNVDKNNNDPTLVMNGQPITLPPSTKITSSSITPPNATSTPKRTGSCSSNDGVKEGETGFENQNAESFAARHTDAGYEEENLDDDTIGLVLDQVVEGLGEDDLDSGLETSVSVEHTLEAFRKRHNLDVIDANRSTMTPPPPHVHPSDATDDAYDECFQDILVNDDDDYDDYDDSNLHPEEDEDSDACCSISDDATINVEDVDSRDENLSCSDTDPVERPPEPQPVQDETSREVSPFSPSSNVSDKDGDEVLDEPEVKISTEDEVITKVNDSTTHAITNILSELVMDTPNSDHHTNVAISR